MLDLFFFLVAIFSLIFLTLTNYSKHGKLKRPPGPKGLPLIGNLHQLDPSMPHMYFFKLGRIYGPILSLKLGFKSMVVIQSASVAKEVLKTQDHNLCNRPALVAYQRLSYDGLDLAFAPYNDYYKEMRKICVLHLFSSKKVQSSASIRREEVSRMMHRISSVSSASETVNLSELVTSLTCSIICRVAFGKRYKDEGPERSRFRRLLDEAEMMLAASYFADYFPFIGTLLDQLTGTSSELERVFKDLDEFYDEVINDHLVPNWSRDGDHNDIVDILLQLQKERCSSFELTLDHIKAVLMNILLAGTDTIAVMIIWAMVELVRNPMVMRKVQDELRTTTQNKSFIEEEDLPKLVYLQAVMKETFRLHPADPLLLARETLEKCTIKGYDVLPKTLLVVNVWAIGRDPESWEDPETFTPERFLGSSVDFKGHNFELIPFGAGRRMCPGMNLGIAEFGVALANLLYSFDWEVPRGLSKEDIDYDVIPGIAMHKKTPLCLMAKKFTPSYNHVTKC